MTQRPEDYVIIALHVDDPLMAVAERNLDLPRDLPVLAGNDQLDPAELVLGQVITENLQYAIDAFVEFSFVVFRVIGATHAICDWADGPAYRVNGRQAVFLYYIGT
jgi:hypothetical protein